MGRCIVYLKEAQHQQVPIGVMLGQLDALLKYISA